MSTQDSLKFNHLLELASAQGASDLHLNPGSAPLIRIKKNLVALHQEEIVSASFTSNLAQIELDEDELQKLERERSLVRVREIKPSIRIRFVFFYERGHVSLACRFLKDEVSRFSDLGLPEPMEKFLTYKRGLLFISGPYRSGKTTVAASFLNEINRREAKRILTLERPVELAIPAIKSLVEQRQVGDDTPTFLQGLNEAKESDFDVIFISEVTSGPVAEALLDLAEGGRLIVAICESSSPEKVIEQYISFFDRDRVQIARERLADLFVGVVGLRLVTGRKGEEILASEVLLETRAVRNIIREGRTQEIPTIIQISRSEGMISLDQSLVDLVRRGDVLPEAARAEAHDPDLFSEFK